MENDYTNQAIGGFAASCQQQGLGGMYPDDYQQLVARAGQQNGFSAPNEEINLSPEWRLEIRGRADHATNVSVPTNNGAREAALKAARTWIDGELMRMASLGGSSEKQ